MVKGMIDQEYGFEDRVALIVTKNIPGCIRLKSCDRLSGGASQETYRLLIETVDTVYPLAMRRSRDGAQASETSNAPGLDMEANLFSLARSTGIPEPEIFHVLDERDGIGEGFIMEWVEGEALVAKIARSLEFAEDRKTLARQCGENMAKIHAIDLQKTGLSQHLAEVTPEQFVLETWTKYQEFDTNQPMLDYSARWLLENLPTVDRLSLVHNDFRNGNLMVRPGEGVVAVLDWELAHIGDPMRDLGWLCTSSWRFGVAELPVGGFGRREDLFAGYEAVSGKKVDPQHVKFWEVFGSFWWAVTCLGMVDMYRQGSDASVERLAIGRRSSEGQVDCVNLLIPGAVAVPQDSQCLYPRKCRGLMSCCPA